MTVEGTHDSSRQDGRPGRRHRFYSIGEGGSGGRNYEASQIHTTHREARFRFIMFRCYDLLALTSHETHAIKPHNIGLFGMRETRPIRWIAPHTASPVVHGSVQGPMRCSPDARRRPQQCPCAPYCNGVNGSNVTRHTPHLQLFFVLNVTPFGTILEIKAVQIAIFGDLASIVTNFRANFLVIPAGHSFRYSTLVSYYTKFQSTVNQMLSIPDNTATVRFRQPIRRRRRRTTLSPNQPRSTFSVGSLPRSGH